MVAGTQYLYGDSTAAPLRTNFIALLSDVVDFGVTALACDARIAEMARQAADRTNVTEKEIEQAEALGLDVSLALQGAANGDAESLAVRCANKIQLAAADLLRAEVDLARAQVMAQNAHAAASATDDRGACLRAFAGLVLRHELPDEDAILEVRLQDGGARYDAELHARTPYGLHWVAALDVPTASELAQPLRIERLVERVEVHAPEEGGWLRKETKLRAQRLERLYLTKLIVDRAETAVTLRTNPDGSAGGFDLSLRREPTRARLVRVAEGGSEPAPPYDVEGDDAGKLWALADKLVSAASALRSHKKSIVKASLDETPIEQLEAPRTLVDRIVEHIAPTVQEITRRSLTPGELVLKRQVDESHREELFVSRTELEQKVRTLPAGLWNVFAALGIAPGAAPPPARSKPPARLPSPPSSSRSPGGTA